MLQQDVGDLKINKVCQSSIAVHAHFDRGGVPKFDHQGGSQNLQNRVDQRGCPKFSKTGLSQVVLMKLSDLTLKMATLRCFSGKHPPRLVLKWLKVC